MAPSEAAQALLNIKDTDSQDLLATADALRLQTNARLNPKRRSELGQFMTPAPVARLMASMIGDAPEHLRLLDAGAGVGSLTAAAIAELLLRPRRPRSIHVTAFEIDPVMITALRETLATCERECTGAGITFTAEAREEDFLDCAAGWLGLGLFATDGAPRFDLAIQNPPYKKMHSTSRARSLTRAIGIETSNLYTAFLAATIGLLNQHGQLVAISPRSFCNGPYFRPFRELFLSAMGLGRIHVFRSRQEAFKDDEVLQETIIVSAFKGSRGDRPIYISSSKDAISQIASRLVPMKDVVNPKDPNRFIHVRSDHEAEDIATRMVALPCTLEDLGINVSTGRVVDFRASAHLRSDPDPETVPLIYPGHLAQGGVVWPRPIRKPNALHLNSETRDLTVPVGPYVLTKRFSAKEERRRVVASVFDPASLQAKFIGFENHLNYYHRAGAPLDIEVARGLAGYLNTTLVDEYFRQFNGHTQVNATDLRSLRYPSAAQLRRISAKITDGTPDQFSLDALVTEALT